MDNNRINKTESTAQEKSELPKAESDNEFDNESEIPELEVCRRLTDPVEIDNLYNNGNPVSKEERQKITKDLLGRLINKRKPGAVVREKTSSPPAASPGPLVEDPEKARLEKIFRPGESYSQRCMHIIKILYYTTKTIALEALYDHRKV